jgi:hypothetical protein
LPLSMFLCASVACSILSLSLSLSSLSCTPLYFLAHRSKSCIIWPTPARRHDGSYLPSQRIGWTLASETRQGLGALIF